MHHGFEKVGTSTGFSFTDPHFSIGPNIIVDEGRILLYDRFSFIAILGEHVTE